MGSCRQGNRFRQCDMKKRKYTASLETERDECATERESYRQEGFLRSIVDIQQKRINEFELQNASAGVRETLGDRLLPLGNRFRRCDVKKRKHAASLEREEDRYATERESYRQEGF